jgi:hypothetical protein
MGVAYFVSALLMYIAKPPLRPVRDAAETVLSGD